MDRPRVHRRAFLKATGVGVAASAIALSVPAGVLAASNAEDAAERFLLDSGRGHVEPAVYRYVARAIRS